MDFQLERLERYQAYKVPPVGTVRLIVARNDPEGSEECSRAVEERNTLLRSLETNLGIKGIEWGRALEEPSEIIEIGVPLVASVIPPLAQLLIDWVKARRDTRGPSITGFKVARSFDGATLEVNYKNISDPEEMMRITQEFLSQPNTIP